MDVHLWCSCLPAGRGQPAARYMHAGGDRDPKRRRQREEKKLNTGGSEGQGSLLHTTPACIAYPSAGTWLSARPGGPVGIARSAGSDPAAVARGESTGLCVCARPDACRRRARALTWIAHVWIQRAISY
ncbi:hypothetical protein BDA96_01G561300 [Sorghum bicolor]|uniref:Uncharacterized protein n=1 Tax=Sorghum bicolor TaxID=4558 RepID=A0A921V4E5_SORBI|nr:hypothetical protein BDA96_01G561300 [Sorghum bicolor]